MADRNSTTDGPDPLPTQQWEREYRLHAEPLVRFLTGVLKDASLAQDVTQTAFTRLLEQGGGVSQESRKAWLFQVAYREALALRRSQETGRRAQEQAFWIAELRKSESVHGSKPLVRDEEIERIRMALQELPPKQRQIVQLRIYQEKKFAEIATELGIPLGTALARMRNALKRLRSLLGPHE